MKPVIIASLALFGSVVSGYSQGAIIVKNFGGGSNGSITPTASVTIKDTTTKTGTSYLVQLYAGAAGTAESALTAIGSPFSALANGLFGSPTVVIPGVAIGSQAAVQVRIWDSAFGSTYEAALGKGNTGTSSLLTIALGDAGSTTPNSVPTLVGMTAFTVSVVPEPTTIALAGIGGLALLGMRRKTA